MGTNYYVTDDPTCNNAAHNQPLHIGKSSVGWVFSFHAVPAKKLTSWREWQRFLVGRVITDEYGRETPLGEFAAMVSRKQNPVSRSRLDPQPQDPDTSWVTYHEPDPAHEWLDADGHDFQVGDFC